MQSPIRSTAAALNAAAGSEMEVIDRADGRRELARLIGRLLADEWLARKRSEDAGHAGHDSRSNLLRDRHAD